MITQSSRATIAPFAVPANIFDEVDIDNLKDIVSGDDQKRIDSAVEGKFYVYPSAEGLYTVKSLKEGRVENIYTVNMNGSEFSCDCEDYIYNSVDGIKCKHIWRVLLLIQLNALPDRDIDPYAWLISELYSDRKWLNEKQNDDNVSDIGSRINKLNRIEKEITKKRPQDVNYPSILDKRAKIMIHPLP